MTFTPPDECTCYVPIGRGQRAPCPMGHPPKQADVFECRFCKKKVDFLQPYHFDPAGLWHWDCGPAR